MTVRVTKKFVAEAQLLFSYYDMYLELRGPHSMSSNKTGEKKRARIAAEMLSLGHDLRAYFDVRYEDEWNYDISVLVAWRDHNSRHVGINIGCRATCDDFGDVQDPDSDFVNSDYQSAALHILNLITRIETGSALHPQILSLDTAEIIQKIVESKTVREWTKPSYGV
jgi:hypothetical protein